MARYTESVCRICRRENLKMYLKGDRCYTDKCAIERRPYPPGQHGQGRVKFSEYGVQLREKQKVKRMYGLLESQFRGYCHQRRRRQGQDRREPAPGARAPPRQRRLPARLRRHPQRGAAAGAPRPLPGERPQGEHPLATRCAPATIIEVTREEPEGGPHRRGARGGRSPRRAGLARAGQEGLQGHGEDRARPARTSPCRSRSS